MSSAACPTDAALERYASGLLGSAALAELVDHVQHCQRCQENLARLAPSHLALGQHSGAAGDATDVATTPGTDREPLAITRPFAEEPEDLDDEIDLSFLQPSASAQALGRLGKYEVLRVLGRGGMGLVFQAFDDALQRTVAIKVLAPELASSAKARRRFVREGRAAAAINHPNVVIIHAVDEQNNMPYLVMEYVAGCSLRDRLHRPPRLQPVEIVRIGVQIASGLAAAHEQGVIHRDIKPSNILLEDGVDRVKIADFGLARAAMDLTDITTLGHGVGTPSYVSPEQVTGGTTDHRSDLFSLGCVLYAMAVGHSPFRGRLALEVIRQVADHHPPPLFECDSRIPQSLSKVVEKLLEKKPQNRYQSAREVMSALNEQLSMLNQMPSDQLPTVAPATRRSSRRPARRVVVGVAAMLAALAAVWSVTTWLRPKNKTVENGAAAAPAKSIEPVRANAIVSVGQDEQADFSSLADALADLGPNSTVRIVDAATYDTPLVINDEQRFRGLRIESPRHAALQTSSSLNASLVSVSDTAEVVIDGLRLLANKDQHALWIGGNVSGVRIENVVCQHPSGAGRAIVVIDQAVASPTAPLVLRNCTIESAFGLAVLGRDATAVSGLIVESCRFRIMGSGPTITLENLVRQVVIKRNVFTGESSSMGIHIGAHSSQVQVDNNTFYDLFDWVGINPQAIDQQISVKRNLVLRCKCLLHENSDIADVVEHCLSDNWWELSAGAEQREVRAVCAPHEPMSELPVVSRDPASSDFLRPRPSSPLAGTHEEDFIGAIPPVKDDPTADAETR
jgi:eukaryotic-like serine/threonine-protein kinase